MPVALTNLPLPWSAAPSLIDFGVDQTAPMGGAQQRDPRVGSRWSVKFASMPDLAFADAQVFLGARLLAEVSGSTVSAAWPQAPAPTGLGAPVVDGAGQGGGALAVRGFTAGVTVPGGLWFSVWAPSASGNMRSFIYQTVDDQVADGSGRATLDIAPFIRVAPADGAALNFTAPIVEGFIEPGVDWELAMLAWVTLPAFSISEVE